MNAQPVSAGMPWTIRFLDKEGRYGVIVCRRSEVPALVERLVREGHKVVAKAENGRVPEGAPS